MGEKSCDATRMSSSSPPQAARPGDLDAKSLFRAHARFVCAFIERLGVRAPTSHDLVQDVFLIVHRKGGYRTGAASPTTWLASIALGVVRNHRRRAQTRVRGATLLAPGVESSPPATDPLTDRADARRALGRVREALDSIEESQRVVFMLYEIEGQSTADIASGLGVATGTVYSRLHAARKAFRKAYAQRPPAAAPGKGQSDLQRDLRPRSEAS